MTFKDRFIGYVKKTPLSIPARELYIHFSPHLRAKRQLEKRDLARLGYLLQEPLYPTDGKTKTVLLMGMGQVRFIAQESIIRKSFEIAGYRCVVLVPKDRIVLQAYRKLGSDILLFFDHYLPWRSRYKAQQFPAFKTLNDLTELCVDGVRCGKYAASTLMRRMRSGSFDMSSPDVRGEMVGALDKSLRCLDAAQALIARIKPDALVLVDRGYSPSGELFDSCIERGIPVITWNAAHKNDTLMLKRYTAANRDVHPSSLSDKSWDVMRNLPWGDEHWRKLKHEIEYCYASGEWYAEVGTQFNKKQLTKPELLARLGVDASKKTAVIFPHIFWDATFFWGEDLFESYEDWFIQTVREAAKNDRMNWVIKVHPANLIKDKRDGFSGEHSEIAAIRKAVGTLPAHIKLLPADSDISTISLFAAMDVCVTVRGTVGIEAACFGVPVLTAGSGRFDRLGFTIDSGSKEEYLQRIATAETIAPMDDAKIELARKYAYGFLLCRPAPLRAMKMRYQQTAAADLFVEYQVASAQELRSSEDVKSIARWINSQEEDYLQMPLDASLPKSTPITWTPELVQRFWDYHAQFPETYFTSQYGKGIIRSVKKYLPKDGMMMDYACGTGALIGHMVRQGLRVAACDLSNDSLAVVNKRFDGKANFLGTRSIKQLRSTDERFDAVFLVELIEHVNDADLDTIFADVSHTLKPGGLVVITTPNNENLADSTVFCPCCSKTFHRWQHVRSWSQPMLSDLLAGHGMEPVKLFATDFAIVTQGRTFRNMLRLMMKRIRGRSLPHLVAVARKPV